MRSLLAVHEAAQGSSVYVVAGGSSSADFTRHVSHLPGVAESFAANGWYVDSLVLPESSDQATGFLQSLASASGGGVLQLSKALDLGPIGDSILRQDVSGSLYEAGSSSLGYGEVMSTLITVLPGTQEATLLIFKKNPFGSLVLTNPSGLNVSANGRGRRAGGGNAEHGRVGARRPVARAVASRRSRRDGARSRSGCTTRTGSR